MGASPDNALTDSEIKGLPTPPSNHSTDTDLSTLISLPASPSMYSASSATLLHSNIARSGTSRCRVFCTREAICVASSECPPSSKKLSLHTHPLDLQRPAPRSPASLVSSRCAVPGKPGCAPGRYPVTGRALRSSLPLALSGSVSRNSEYTAPCYSGRLRRLEVRYTARRALGLTCAMTPPGRPPVLCRPRALHADGCLAQAACGCSAFDLPQLDTEARESSPDGRYDRHIPIPHRRLARQVAGRYRRPPPAR